MMVIYYFSYDIISYFNPTNRYFLSDLLQLAVLYPVLIAISIPLKQLVLGWNYRSFYINTTTVTVFLNLLAIIALLPIYKIYAVFYSSIITEAIVILIYLICIRKNWFQNSNND